MTAAPMPFATLSLVRLIEGLVLSALLCGCATNPRKAAAGVVVARLDAVLPADKNQRSLWLSEHIDSQEGKFGSQTTREWRRNYDVFSRALSEKANRLGFDSESLSRIINCILEDAGGQPLAYLPVAAYETTLNGEPVWIVAVHWEEYFGPEVPIPAMAMSHIRSYAFTQRDLKQVGFITCH
jgi:hypothetical protein